MGRWVYKGSYTYVASPYTHNDEAVIKDRLEKVTDYVFSLMDVGMVVYSPIIHYHPIAQRHRLPTHADYWTKFNFAMLRQASDMVILTLDGWEESKGVQREREWAALLGIPVNYGRWNSSLGLWFTTGI